MNTRARMTALAVAFLFGSAVWPAGAGSDDAQKVDKMRAAIAARAEAAIEKQGGSRLLFKVDPAALRDVMVTGLRDDLYRILREGRIPFSGLAIHDGGVDVRIADAKNRQAVASKLMPASGSTPRAPTISVADGGDGLMRLTPTESGFAERLSELVGQSLEMIEQGLRNNHTPAGLERNGADRIRVLLPGVTDPDRVAAMFSRRAHVAFRMVDDSMSAEEAQKAGPPPASEVLYDFKTKAPHLVLKEIAIEGDDIVDASPGFLSNSDQPIASFRFNAHGARRFAEITTANVGRAFAVVVDDRVLSAAVIREPILGGSGQISGNLTLEEANIVAMLLRSGTLPGRLSIVEQQVVDAAGTAGKP